MTVEDTAYGDEIVEQHWYIDGPHNDHTTCQAGNALSSLVRFLNHATGTGHRGSAMPHAATANSVVSYLRGAVGGMPQLLNQLADFLDSQADDPLLYDDRRFSTNPVPAEQTATMAAAALREAAQQAAKLMDPLTRAGSYTVHLGNDDPPQRPRRHRLDWTEGEDFG
jgi:hypothetical protein